MLIVQLLKINRPAAPDQFLLLSLWIGAYQVPQFLLQSVYCWPFSTFLGLVFDRKRILSVCVSVCGVCVGVGVCVCVCMCVFEKYNAA